MWSHVMYLIWYDSWLIQKMYLEIIFVFPNIILYIIFSYSQLFPFKICQIFHSYDSPLNLMRTYLLFWLYEIYSYSFLLHIRHGCIIFIMRTFYSFHIWIKIVHRFSCFSLYKITFDFYRFSLTVLDLQVLNTTRINVCSNWYGKDATYMIDRSR